MWQSRTFTLSPPSPSRLPLQNPFSSHLHFLRQAHWQSSPLPASFLPPTLSFSLSTPLSLSLSHRASYSLRPISPPWWPNGNTRQPGTLKGFRSPWAKLGHLQITTMAARVHIWRGHKFTVVDHHFSSELDGGSWSHKFLSTSSSQ